MALLLNKRLNGVVLAFVFFAASSTAYGQINQYIQQGNKLYDQQKYKEAAEDYARAIKKDPHNTPSYFNLGNTLYQQKQFDSSRKVLATTEKLLKDKNGKAATNYNIGNTYMSQQKWEDAINSYKQTLRANPQDVDAKYNLSYAEEMLKKQQNQNKNKQDKDKQDKQNKDQKDKNKQDQDKKDKQDKDKQDKQDQKDQQNKDQQEPQGQPSKMSKQDAENLLNALQQQEKKLQDKMNKEKGVPTKMEKDW